VRRVFKWVGIVAAGAVAAVASLPFFINVDRFKPSLEAELSKALNREVKLGKLHLSLWRGEVSADDLSVSEDQAFGKPAFVSAKQLSVGAEIWPFLMSRKLKVTHLTIDRPEIVLTQAPSGNWNFSSLGGKASAPAAAPTGGEPLDLSVKIVRITDGSVRLGRTVGHWKPLLLHHVNAEVRDFSASSAFPFTMSADVAGGGSIEVKGQAGPIDASDSAMTPVNVSLKVAALDLAGSGMNDFAPDLAGLLTVDGSGVSDGHTMQVSGKVRADKLRLSRRGTPSTRPVVLDFVVHHDLRKHMGTLQQGDVHIGGAVAHLTGTYAEEGDAMTLKMRLAGPAMPVGELEALLPSLGIVLPAGSRLQGGAATVALAMEGPADRLVTVGSVALNRSRLTGFDLPKKMETIERLAGVKGGADTEIETLSADVRVGPEGASASGMKLVLPAIGELSGAGSVSPANELDFKMRAIVHTSGVMAAVADTPIPFTVQGTCADPVFRPDLKAVAAEKVKSVGKSAGGLLRGLLGGKK